MKLSFDEESTVKDIDVLNTYVDEMFMLSDADFVHHVDVSSFIFFDVESNSFKIDSMPQFVDISDMDSQVMYNNAVRKQLRVKSEQVRNVLDIDNCQDCSHFHYFNVYTIPLKEDVSWEQDFSDAIRLLREFIIGKKYIEYGKKLYGDNNIEGIVCVSHLNQVDDNNKFLVPHIHILYKDKGLRKSVNELYDLLVLFLKDNLNIISNK